MNKLKPYIVISGLVFIIVSECGGIALLLYAGAYSSLVGWAMILWSAWPILLALLMLYSLYWKHKQGNKNGTQIP